MWRRKLRVSNANYLISRCTQHELSWLFTETEATISWLDYTIRIGSIPTFLYFDLYLYSAYAAHFVYKLVIYRGRGE